MPDEVHDSLRVQHPDWVYLKMLTVQVYELDKQANFVRVGAIRWDGHRLTASNKEPVLQLIMHEPIDLPPIARKNPGLRERLHPADDPERFIRCLHWCYHLPYLNVSEAVTVSGVGSE
jgi:hypothetical protein